MMFACPACASPMQSHASQAGTRVYCPQCGQKVQVPPNATVLGNPLPTLPPGPTLPPNRGVVIMVLGIVSSATALIAAAGSLVFLPFLALTLASVPTGIIAWTLGHQDRAGIRGGRLSRDNESFVLAGYVCGIAGSSVAALTLVACGLFGLMCFGLLASMRFGGAGGRPF